METKLLKVFDKLTFEDSQVDSIGFIGQSNIWIAETFTYHTQELVQTLIMQAIKNTAAGQIEVYSYDNQLTGIFAPFSSYTSGEYNLINILTEQNELNQLLQQLKKHIFGVQNVIQGQAKSLYEFRKDKKKAIESYKLVILNLNLSTLSEEVYSLLSHLFEAGPRAGVTFMLIDDEINANYMQFYNTSMTDVNMLKAGHGKISFMQPGNFQKPARIVNETSFQYLTPIDIIEENKIIFKKQTDSEKPLVTFQEIHPEYNLTDEDLINQIWHENLNENFQPRDSINGVTFSLGKYGDDILNVTIGDEVNQRHNALITGAVGQGKSNLISVIIHSLSIRYSPEELELYLLDFKEGVSLKAYTGFEDGVYLPHARALALESDVEYGLSVLEYLYDIYKERMRKFKKNNVKSLREYRENFSDTKMARIVIIIDEFQLMFGDNNRFGEKVATLLEKSVRLYRAAGIHFILASQSIAGNMALMGSSDQIFSQIPIRIAHKNSIEESQRTLGTGNLAASTLRPREAIVNTDYGAEQQNRKIIAAFGDEKLLQPIRRVIWEKGKSIKDAPRIFDSEQKITVRDTRPAFKEIAKEKNLALIGRNINVDSTPAKVHFDNEFGENLLMLGSPGRETNHVIGMMEAMIYSLVLNSSSDTSFSIYNFQDSKANDLFYAFIDEMKKINSHIKIKDTASFLEDLKDIEENHPDNQKHYIFALGLDRFRPKDMDLYSPPLQEFLSDSSMKGIHFIGWWMKENNLSKQVGDLDLKATDLFSTRVFLNIDAQIVQNYTTLETSWTSEDNRVLIYDEIYDVVPRTIIPYSPLKKI